MINNNDLYKDYVVFSDNDYFNDTSHRIRIPKIVNDIKKLKKMILKNLYYAYIAVCNKIALQKAENAKCNFYYEEYKRCKEKSERLKTTLESLQPNADCTKICKDDLIKYKVDTNVMLNLMRQKYLDNIIINKNVDGNHFGDNQLIFMKFIIEFANKYEGVGNIKNGEKQWRDFCQQNEESKKFEEYYNFAVMFSAEYQKRCKEDKEFKILTGNANPRKDKIVGMRLKRIPVKMLKSLNAREYCNTIALL